VTVTEVERHRDATSFLERAHGFLLAREAQHNLILGLSARLRTEPRLYGEDPYFATALDGDRVVGVTMRTPPHNLILSEFDDEAALEPIAGDAQAVFGSLPGVVGPKDPVAKFARIWEERTGAKAEVGIRQRVYCASQVVVPGGISGSMRAYEDGDRDRVIAWMLEFVEEALPAAPPEDAEHWLERKLASEDGGVVIWVDGDPVSFAGYGGLTPNGIRVGPVYTPPDLRRRGYASALTAELTKMLLDGGRKFCFLFTDLANPTSNSIYQRIGYEAVSDADQWVFGGGRSHPH
jgi:predicted GNAT family acetyltransferase